MMGVGRRLWVVRNMVVVRILKVVRMEWMVRIIEAVRILKAARMEWVGGDNVGEW